MSLIVLTKENNTINLTKSTIFPRININLMWNVGPSVKKWWNLWGILPWGKQQPIDLDLGAFVRMKDGSTHLIQALGSNFGSEHSEPFVKLDADDLTGECIDGENLFINSRHWDQIDEVLVYTFIYKGVAKWYETNGRVLIDVNGADPVLVNMNEYYDSNKFCAIASLKNVNGQIKVTRENKML